MPKAMESAKKTVGALGELLHAVTGLVSRKKATDGQENTDAKSKRRPKNTYAETLRKLAKEKKSTRPANDPAHAPGHRKLSPDGASSHVGGKVQPQNDSVVNNNAKSDRIHQTESPQRRLIPGASIERKGRRG